MAPNSPTSVVPEGEQPEMDFTDSAGLTDSWVLDGYGSDHDVIERGGDGRKARAEITGDGVEDRIEDGASSKDARELRVAQLLVAKLRELGQDWDDPTLTSKDARAERGIDCIAKSRESKQELRIQTTMPETEAWAILGRSEGAFERQEQLSAAVASLWQAINRKRNDADPSIVLALDAVDSLRTALRPVVDQFRTEYRLAEAKVRYSEIWIVGPTTELVHRIDV